MPSFVTVTSGATAQAQDVNQLINALNGSAGNGIPISLTAVNDSVNFALALKNADPTNSRTLQVLRANNNVLIQADANGVIVSPDGGVTTGQVVTVNSAQTFSALKTFTAGITVSAGNIGVGGAPNANIAVQNVATINTQGFFAGGTLTAIANGTNLYGFHAGPTLSAAGFTGNVYAGVQIDGVAAPAGFTNNYGLSVGTPSGATGENYAIKASGVSFVGGAGGGLIVSSNLGVAPTAPAGTIALGSGTGTTATAGTNGAPPAQVAGYWFINVAGTIGKVAYYNN